MAEVKLVRPNYDPQQCQVGIVHLGVGNFHRAHQAVYVDSLLERANARCWGIAGLNLMPGENALIDSIAARKMRYVLKTISPSGDCAYREIASLLIVCDRPAHMAQSAALLADPKAQLVTLTVTGSGYYLDEDGALDTKAAAIAAEIDGGSRNSIYGTLYEGLSARKEAKAGPVTVLSCDNMRYNGQLLRHAMENYLAAVGDADLAAWIADNVTFPSSVVDRITPVTPADLSAEIEREFGIAGDPSLMAESFTQWVIEDDFAGKRPPLDEVGVTFVESALPYEEAKIRILNAGHTAVAAIAALRGHTFVWEAMRDPEVAAFFDRFQVEEAIPAIENRGQIDLHGYMKAVKERFGSPYLDDTLARICRRGTSKVPEFILPTIVGTFEQGRMPEHSLAVVANWYALMRLCDSGKGPFEYVDPDWDKIRPALKPGGERDFAMEHSLWGDLPRRHPEFVDALVSKIGQVAV